MITVKIASIASRSGHLEKIVAEHINSADIFEVYLNNYERIPEYLINKKIKIYNSQKYGDRGDCGKFFNIEKIAGYVFFFDDDIQYPVNYIESMMEKIDVYGKTSLICVHGNILPDNYMKSYYKEKKGLHFSKQLMQDTIVDIPGTGTLCLHTDGVKIPYDIFKSKNMTDLWVGFYAIQKKIPVLSVARGDEWLQQIYFNGADDSIYKRYNKNDALQTEVANNIINLKKETKLICV